MKKQKEKQVSPSPLPKEIIEIVDRKELLLTGVTGIGTYTESEITLKTKSGTVTVTGDGIVMAWAGNGKILLTGNLLSVTFQNCGKGKAR